MAYPTTDDRPLTTEPLVRWRVATIAHDGTALWRIQPAEFAERALAEEWAHQILWLDVPGEQRPRNAALLRVVDGVVQAPFWMRLWLASDEDDGEGKDADDGAQEASGGRGHP